jgi:hypothetical protein
MLEWSDETGIGASMRVKNVGAGTSGPASQAFGAGRPDSLSERHTPYIRTKNVLEGNFA